MKKTYLLILTVFCFLKFNVSFSQEVSIDLNYHYLYSPSLDRYIQTYNFARPFLQKSQPLLQNGMNIKIGAVFSANEKVYHGGYVSNSLFISAVNNQGYRNNYIYYLFGVGYRFKIDNVGTENFFLEGEIGYLNSRLSRIVNGQTFAYSIDYDFIDALDDGENTAYSRSPGHGASISIGAGYKIDIGDKLFIVPKIGFSWVPFLISRNNERVINQTRGYIATKNSQYWGTVGISCIYKYK